MDDSHNPLPKDNSTSGSLPETTAHDEPHVKNKKSTKKTGDEHSDQSVHLSVKKMMVYRQIGAKIAYYRTLRQMSQAELAKRANLSSSTLGRIERGKYNNGVPISTLLDIAEGLRIELSALVTFSEEEKKVWWEIDKNML